MTNVPININNTSGVLYYRQIFDQLEGLIRSGQLPPGAVLPSVRDLAKQTLVSLITIRRAYRDLADAGLILRQQGRGTFVAEVSNTSNREEPQRAARSALEQAVIQSIQVGIGHDDVGNIVIETLASVGANSGEKR